MADLDGGTKVLAADVLLPFFGLSMDLGAIAGWGWGWSATGLAEGNEGNRQGAKGAKGTPRDPGAVLAFTWRSWRLGGRLALCRPLPRYRVPRTSRPGSAPVARPSRCTTWPLTMVAS